VLRSSRKLHVIIVGAYLALGLPVACGSRTPLFFEPDGSSSSGGAAGTGGFAGFAGSGGTFGEGLDGEGEGETIEGGEDAFGDGEVFDGGLDGSFSCEPGTLTGFTPGLNASAVSAGMCTAKQIAAIVNDCFIAGPDAGSACMSLLADAATMQCLSGCVYTDWTAAASGVTYTPTPWGGLVYLLNPGQTGYVDLGACLAKAAPTDKTVQACAKDNEELLECTLQACAANCPVPMTSDDCSDPSCEAAENALSNCMAAVTSGSCAKYQDAVTTDCASLMDAGSGPVFDCIHDVSAIDNDEDAGAEAAALIQFLDIVCLGALPDGG
jgi:hypothetical protein